MMNSRFASLLAACAMGAMAMAPGLSTAARQALVADEEAARRRAREIARLKVSAPSRVERTEMQIHNDAVAAAKREKLLAKRKFKQAARVR